MKIGKLMTMRSRWIQKGRRTAFKEYKEELLKIEKQGREALLSLENEYKKKINGLSDKQQKSLSTLEKNYQKEIKAITAQTERLNKQLERRIQELNDTIEVRDAEVYKLKQLTEKARLEAARRNIVGDRVLKEASLLVKAQNELEHLEAEADVILRKSNKKLKLAK